MLKKLILSYRDTLLITALAIPVGILSGGATALFGHVLLLVTAVREAHTYLLIPFLGAAGVLIVWCYQKYGGESIRGMGLIFEAGHGARASVPLRLIPFTMAGTWLTHLFGGSAGREGAAVQIGGAIAHGLGARLKTEHGKRLLLITGMAAGFGGLFRTPLAAAFFALEALTVGALEHRALLPALTASFLASYVSGLLGLEKFSFLLGGEAVCSWTLLLKAALLGILFGITGGLFSFCLHKTKDILTRRLQNPLLRVFVTGVAVSALTLLLWGGRYAGLGTSLISISLNGGAFPWDFALKAFLTVLTLASGFQGGEVTPLFAIGASLGAALAPVLGLPVAFGAALGYAAVFGGATNTLIAPMLIGAEVFGFQYFPCFAIACALAYTFNGDFSIYPLQRRRDVT